MPSVKQSSIIDYNVQINKVLEKLVTSSSNEAEKLSLQKLRNRLSLLRSSTSDGAELVVSKSTDFFNKYSDRITNRASGEKLLSTVDFRAEYVELKGADAQAEDQHLFDLADSIRSRYISASAEEKDYLYDALLNLHNLSVQYQLEL